MKVKEYKDMVYGPHDRNNLDAYIVDTEVNETEANDSKKDLSPVFIYFHGGGYVSGDKKDVLTMELMKECIEAGISVVSCNYRFITNEPFPAPMADGTRAIQFVRSMADVWGLDARRIVSSGESAGGHIALWNALAGNLAKLDSPDHVERISSDVSAFVGFATQVSKDQRFYDGIYKGPHIQPNLTLFYGIPSIKDLKRPDILKLAEEASAIHYMSPAAPPAFMVYNYDLDMPQPCIPSDASVGEVIHHPMHGYILKQKYDELNIPYVLRHNKDPEQPGEIIRFICKYA